MTIDQHTQWRGFYRKRILVALRQARALALRGRRAEAFARLDYAAGMRRIFADSVTSN